jgi:hypothetical protein
LPRRLAAIVLGSSAALVGLAGCHTPGGAVKQSIIVEFVTYDSSAAKPVIIAACGHLPGETVDPGRAGDPNLILDVTHANALQQGAISKCIDDLQSSQPKLMIRTVEIDNGLDN